MITNPAFPTYPYALSAQQVSAGLVAPAAAVTIMGKGGAIATLLIVFMAATSACSAELIAVSSLVTRDIIGTYRPLSGRKVNTGRPSQCSLVADRLSLPTDGPLLAHRHRCLRDLGWSLVDHPTLRQH
jgi:hypothetical protein